MSLSHIQWQKTSTEKEMAAKLPPKHFTYTTHSQHSRCFDVIKQSLQVCAVGVLVYQLVAFLFNRFQYWHGISLPLLSRSVRWIVLPALALLPLYYRIMQIIVDYYRFPWALPGYDRISYLFAYVMGLGTDPYLTPQKQRKLLLQRLSSASSELPAMTVKRLGIKCNGRMLDAVVIAKKDSCNAKRWMVLSNSPGMLYESISCDTDVLDRPRYQWLRLANELDCPIILYNSSGGPRIDAKIEAHQAVHAFIKHVGGEEVVDVGEGFGGYIVEKSHETLSSSAKVVTVKYQSASYCKERFSCQSCWQKICALLIKGLNRSIGYTRSSKEGSCRPEIVIQKGAYHITNSNYKRVSEVVERLNKRPKDYKNRQDYVVDNVDISKPDDKYDLHIAPNSSHIRFVTKHQLGTHVNEDCTDLNCLSRYALVKRARFMQEDIDMRLTDGGGFFQFIRETNDLDELDYDGRIKEKDTYAYEVLSSQSSRKNRVVFVTSALHREQLHPEAISTISKKIGELLNTQTQR